MSTTLTPRQVCAYCEEAPAVLSHLWVSAAWDRTLLCLVCQGFVLDEPHMPRLVDDDEEDHDDA